MSRLINDLPPEADAIYQALLNDPYSRGDADYSVTDLISPPRKVSLGRKHESELVENASDRIFSIVGQSIHTILERSNKVGIAERRLSVTLDGVKISGGMDLYHTDTGTLIDYKTTSFWAVTHGTKIEWEQQLNIYAYILRHHGFTVNSLKVVAILRDWKKSETRFDASYPKKQIVSINVALWENTFIENYIKERISVHMKAKTELPECSLEERWGTPPKWAVQKEGSDKALKLFEVEEDAKARAASLGNGYYVQIRQGMNRRCQDYCIVANHCNQWKSIQEKNNVKLG